MQGFAFNRRPQARGKGFCRLGLDPDLGGDAAGQFFGLEAK
jgi:hypothetical protein